LFVDLFNNKILMTSPESGLQEWLGLPPQKHIDLIEALTRIELFAGVPLPIRQITDGSLKNKGQQLIDYAERVIADATLWDQIPDQFIVYNILQTKIQLKNQILKLISKAY
jgi:hypothetical protein